MAGSKITDTDFGYKKWLKQMSDMAQKPSVKIGILGDGEAGEDGATVLEYGSYNEFGTKDGKIPERSFIRATIDERKRRIYGKAFQLQEKIFLGKISIPKALAIMGSLIKGNIVQKVVSMRSPANADSTIKAKGSSNPLIDTGRLRQSIDYEVEA